MAKSKEKKPWTKVKKVVDRAETLLGRVDDAGVVAEAKRLLKSVSKTMETYAKTEEEQEDKPGE
jgi:hypothetical protein